VGRWQLPLTAHAIVLGGHVRVGFEDNIYYRKGELATSNAQFVERVVRLAKELNRPVATVQQARELLCR
ncbi:MAG TPA: 3-keto-5-aminohexanoate cleavage protein, partial [bacterium]|nr:3-keto-5-aminohexanoate cleavage protein [bacterium]